MADTKANQQQSSKPKSAAVGETQRDLDVRRYQRLRILGCAPGASKYLDSGHVLRFTNLDEYLDADLTINPSRGEFTHPEVSICGHGMGSLNGLSPTSRCILPQGHAGKHSEGRA